ncbi:MAG: hypothetical protein LBR15_05675, partial [Methanobrevibacter sp.]|jgi:hypothetical protein|nr:hypothetical protein [Candidatus Methanovirga australis]MDR2544067.1 hypothetical protein [Candidatus Methanovirga procula]
MEFKSISAKLPRDEITLFRDYCKRKDVTPSAMIRELILRELEVPIPNYQAGKNHIKYNRKNDNFLWSVDLDTDEKANILEEVNIEFLEDLNNQINNVIKERNIFINKSGLESIPIPIKFLKK